MRFRALILATLMCSCDSWLAADDALLGFPKPNDDAKPGAIVLHGGGRVTDETFERFIELAGGQEARIVFVPSAGFRLADYRGKQEFLNAVNLRYGSWAKLAREGKISSFQFLATDNPADADSDLFIKPLLNATGVWFSGGSQLRVNYRFVGEFPQTTKFQDALLEIVKRGGVIGGTSAGTAAIPEIMTLWSERENPDSPETAVAAHGFGLLRNAIVEQHFQARGGRLERFCKLLRDSPRLDELTGRPGSGRLMVGLAIEESAALVIRRNHLEVIGDARAHIFLKSSGSKSLTWHELDPRETVQLRKLPGAPTALLREETALVR
ncbi:Cyanophycinase-like exopeptidase [Planctopirus limnophila DSM 3776]|uniref:Cyanophycinase-like exopeptidase n=1 Tax=Planctopirus limnophila (strain ATCC 43296 / DSM 3776 / IFAM 1008 / Mu 290) TaxID=521674 RepID=D5SQB1_PLAL2|nr:Type 1 glutamine amidotransferase-like domain-containing protein [Planctopirus limnophila]ADG66363.1 Cyanophycinase-like exopeptidase [Planctopirus limnophila DSM 3776]